MNLDAGEERPVDRLMVLPVQVMVTPHLQIPGPLRIRIMKACQELIDQGVGDVDLVEIVILPELLGVPQLDISESLFEVMPQGASVDQGVLGKVVRPGAVAPMHVGHDNQLHAGSEGDMPDTFKFGKAAHAF